MASFESDSRFARLPNGHVNDEEDDDEPIFGDESFVSNPADGGTGAPGPSNSWRKKYKPEFGDEDNSDNKLNGNHAHEESSFQVQPSSEENSELYAILNLDKDATSQDILRSYRSLAVAFHPDKHKQEHLKTAAESRFQKIQHAYEVLSDPQTRAVYDILGEEGLKSQWQVGQKLKSPEELRAEYEKIRLQKAQTDIEALIRSRVGMLTSLLACGHRLSTSPQTEATISLDASQVVNSNGSFLNAITQLAGADVRQLFMKASTMTTISPKTQITYSGSMLARRNAGGGNLLTTLKHQYSQKLALEVGTTALRPRLVNGKISYAFDADSFLTVESSVRSLSRLPPLNITYGRKITESATGFFKLSTGSSYSFLALLPYAESIPFLQPRAGTVSNLTAGISTSTYSVDVTTDQFLDGQVSASYGNLKIFGHQQHGWKLSTSLAVSFAGAASVNINTDKKLTESTKIGLGIGAGLGNGVLTFKMRVSRLGQRLSIPIILSTDASARLIISTVLVPGLSIASLQYFYLTPRRRDRIARKLRELREEVREQNEEKRKEALEATELLAEQVARKREIEMSKDGLVILEAKYRGAGRHLDPEEIKETELDVTVAVQALVATPQADRSEPRSTTTAESTLVIPGGRSKANIIGFYDILVGSKKQLAITYLFKGRRHYVVYDDYAAVAIPMRAHLVE